MTTHDDHPGTSSEASREALLHALFADDDLSAAELDQLRDVVDLGSTLDRDDLQPAAPPPSLLDDVLRRSRAATDPVDDELFATGRGSHVGPDVDRPGADQPGVDRPGADRPGADQPGVDREAAVVPLAPRRRRRTVVAILGAAAAVLAAIAIVPGDPDPFEDAVALNALADDASGRAVLDGDRVLLDAELPPLTGGAFYEVWLLDADVETLVSLGALRSGGVLVVPEGTDLEVTPVLDVSVEEADGDPSHSGVSVLRGELEA